MLSDYTYLLIILVTKLLQLFILSCFENIIVNICYVDLNMLVHLHCWIIVSLLLYLCLVLRHMSKYTLVYHITSSSYGFDNAACSFCHVTSLGISATTVCCAASPPIQRQH